MAIQKRSPIVGVPCRFCRTPKPTVTMIENSKVVDSRPQEHWLAQNGIALLRGSGRLAGTGVVEVAGDRHTAEHVVLACGADPVIPAIPVKELRSAIAGAREPAAAPSL